MEAFLKDVRQSARMFAKAPAFTLAAIAALTLGIGANTAVFSVVNAVLLKPVSFPDPDRGSGDRPARGVVIQASPERRPGSWAEVEARRANYSGLRR